MLVEWDEKYALGIDIVDGHHRKLLELLNASYLMVLQDKGQEEVGRLLDELIDYTQYHFTAEEELMRNIAYPDTDRHLREHFSFINQVHTFAKEAREGKQYLTVEVFDFIRNWLLEHILTVDTAMGQFMRAGK